MVKRPIIAAGVLLLCGLPGAAKDPQWHELRSEHFHVVTNGSVGRAESTVRQLERFRYLLSQLFPNLRLDPPIPTTVLLFKDKKSIRPYSPLAIDGKAIKIDGFMQPGPERMYLAVDLSGSQRQQTAFHEYVHLVLRLTGGPVPVWLDEGLAEFYENTNIHTKRFEVGLPDEGWWRYLRTERLIPMDTLQEVDHQSPYYRDEKKRMLFYAQSWLTVQYLLTVQDRERQPELAKYMGLIASGLSVKDAYERTFGSDYAVLQKELEIYIRRGQTAFFRGELKEEYEPQPFSAEPLSPVVAKAMASDLWINSGRLPEAEAALRELADLPEQSHEVLYRLGRIRLLQGQASEARKYFDSAIALAPEHLSSRYHAALAWMMSDTGPGISSEDRVTAANRVVELLTPVVEQSRDFSQAQEMLVNAHMMRGDTPDEVLPIVEKILEGGPLRPWLGFMAVDLMVRSERWDDAEEMLRRLGAMALESPWDRQLAQWKDTLEFRKEHGSRLTVRFEGDGEGGESTAARQRAVEPVEPEPVPHRPAKVAFKKGILEAVTCEGEGATLTFRPQGGDAAVLELKVPSLDRLLSWGPGGQDRPLTCGAVGARVGINYRIEGDGSDGTGVVISVEFLSRR